MSVNVNIRIKNMPQIRRAFNASPRIMTRQFRDALWKSALTVQKESMLRTPVLTGRLRASHESRITGAGLGMQAEIEPTAYYGIFVHEGTRFMRARPFLRQGADASMQQIDGFFTFALQSGLNEIGRMT